MKAHLITALVAMNVVFGSAAAAPVSGSAHAQAVRAYDQGFSAEQSGDAQRAVKLYKQAISLEPRETVFYIALGDLYQHKNDLASAEATYKIAMKFDSGNGLLQSAWANLLWAKGDTAESVRTWREASAAVEKAQRNSLATNHGSGGRGSSACSRSEPQCAPSGQPAPATEIAFATHLCRGDAMHRTVELAFANRLCRGDAMHRPAGTAFGVSHHE